MILWKVWSFIFTKTCLPTTVPRNPLSTIATTRIRTVVKAEQSEGKDLDGVLGDHAGRMGGDMLDASETH